MSFAYLPVRAVLAIAAITMAMAGGLAQAAHAEFGVTAGTFTADSFDAAGQLDTRAGAHPFEAATTFDFNTKPYPAPFGGGSSPFPDERVKDIVADLPAGFVGDPSAAEACPRETFYNTQTGIGIACRPTSQVGVADINLSGAAGWPAGVTAFPVYSLQPLRGEVAAFGIFVISVPVLLSAKVNPIDNTIRVTVKNTNEGAALLGQRIALWDAPASHAHDAHRVCTKEGTPDPNVYVVGYAMCNYPLLGASKAFITNPTSCGAPATTKLAVNSWQNPLAIKHYSYTASRGGTECDRVPFEPEVSTSASTEAPDAPTGLDVGIALPSGQDPASLAPSHLRDVRVTLPPGLTINPGSADGLQACTDGQAAVNTDQAFSCPEASKVGTATATTPVLPDVLSGGLYVAAQASMDPASGDMFRVILRLTSEERGIDVRLRGHLEVAPDTGRIVAVFKDNPQLPVSDIALHVKSGSRAPLATPSTCGSSAFQTQLLGWSGRSVERHSPLTVACAPGLGGFSPSLEAGSRNATAGASAPFDVAIAKADGQAALNGVSLSLPNGLLGKLKGNLNTQVGIVRAFAGPGSNPFVLPGKVFLEGRYGDAPFSLRAVVPAKAGPFDLGDVVVRQKIYVDPIDAHVTVVSDPLPTIVKGVPVRLQRLEVTVDKPDFIVNPTSCAAKSVTGTLGSAAGQSAPVADHFQVGDCTSLDLKPNLALTLSGKGQTTDGKHPAVTAVVSQPAGQANLKKVRVALPLSLALDPDNAVSDDLCSFVEGSKADPKCPASSVVGKATAVSPILNEPLSGPVFFVKNERKDPKSGRSIKTTPKLVIPLVGENGVKLTLTGTSTVVDDQLVTTFDNIPDAPVSSFKMEINGGKKGILVVSGDKADICKSTQIADQQIDGQNNKQADVDVFIQTPSCPLKVLSKKVAAKSVALKVGGLSAGKVTVTGKGIKKTTKSITKSTVATITARRSKGKPGKVTVSFDPVGPAKARRVTK